MGQQLILLVTGFALTSVLGGLLGYLLQNRAWAHQHEALRRDEERRQAVKACEEISLLLDRRLYRMRQLYWAGRRVAQGTGDDAELASTLEEYREVVALWNDGLNRTLALAETSFGDPVRAMLGGIYREFALSGQGLEEIVKMVRQAKDGSAEAPRFGYRMTRLSHLVYAVNVRMLSLLSEESVGRSAPRVTPAGDFRLAKTGLEIGDEGGQVRRLQRALRRAGEDVDIDGLFRARTWQALTRLQRSRGLDADGIAGPATWAELPSGAAMPVLRPGSRGDVVAQLQLALADQARGRWESTPQDATGVFDASTFAAVRAFQRWSGLPADGIVGDRTWAASQGDSSLESAVGLKFLVTGDGEGNHEEADTDG